jgi:hypothetical protein
VVLRLQPENVDRTRNERGEAPAGEGERSKPILKGSSRPLSRYRGGVEVKLR